MIYLGFVCKSDPIQTYMILPLNNTIFSFSSPATTLHSRRLQSTAQRGHAE